MYLLIQIIICAIIAKTMKTQKSMEFSKTLQKYEKIASIMNMIWIAPHKLILCMHLDMTYSNYFNDTGGPGTLNMMVL